MMFLARLKKCSSLPANSILESVIALCIIAVCLYVAVLVYSQLFSSRTSPRFYNSKNKMAEVYYMFQVNPDSILSADNDNLNITEEYENAHLQKLAIEFKDSSGVKLKSSYFIHRTDE